MTPIHSILGALFIGLAIVWPLAYFGQQYWKDLVKAEEEKHAKQGGHH
jgi:hypothetical protein